MKRNSSNFYFKEERKNKLVRFLTDLSIDFSNLELLNVAFCHSSYSNEFDQKFENNERLEFLGDSVLNLIITDYLYNLYPNKNEGELSKARSYIVSEDSLSSVAKELDLGEYILLGKGEEGNDGRKKKGILADALEAFIGAYYIDKGFQVVKKFVISTFDIYISLIFNRGDFKDYKGLLQEYIQKKYKISPRYVLDKEEGPDHNKIFYASLYVNDNFISNGSGRCKKEAEMKAAEIAFKTLQNIKI